MLIINKFSEMRGCHADSRVIEFLSHLDLLPREQSIRIGFTRQFLLSLENRAKAFIMYVNDARYDFEQFFFLHFDFIISIKEIF